MNKIIVLVVLSLTTIFVNAQDDAFAKDAEQLVETLSKSAFEPLIVQYANMISEDKREAFTKEVKLTFPSLYKELAKIYMDEFTHQEIKDIIAFYDTPTGKKLADKTGVMSQRGMTAGQTWGMKMGEILGKYK